MSCRSSCWQHFPYLKTDLDERDTLMYQISLFQFSRQLSQPEVSSWNASLKKLMAYIKLSMIAPKSMAPGVSVQWLKLCLDTLKLLLRHLLKVSKYRDSSKSFMVISITIFKFQAKSQVLVSSFRSSLKSSLKSLNLTVIFFLNHCWFPLPN